MKSDHLHFAKNALSDAADSLSLAIQDIAPADRAMIHQVMSECHDVMAHIEGLIRSAAPEDSVLLERIAIECHDALARINRLAMAMRRAT